jgi:hypothetical protein
MAAVMGLVFATTARGDTATFVLNDARGQLFELPDLGCRSSRPCSC